MFSVQIGRIICLFCVIQVFHDGISGDWTDVKEKLKEAFKSEFIKY